MLCVCWVSYDDWISRVAKHPAPNTQNVARDMHTAAFLTICAGNSPATSELPAQRPVTQSFDDFFELHQNKLLS